MKISEISIKNLKKVTRLDLKIPENNKVICFVGENGSNKSSVLTYLYQMMRRTTQEKSPSDDNDFFYQNTYDISQVEQEQYYFIKVGLTHNGSKYFTSEASISDFSSLTEETKKLLLNEFPFQYDEKGKRQFLKNWWGFRDPVSSADIVKESVLLFRPSNRYEVQSGEKSLDENKSKVEPKINVFGRRKFPFRVESGIEEASSYFLDVLLDYFIAINHGAPSFSLYEEFLSVLTSIDSDFSQLTISQFPNKAISAKNLPRLDALSAGQSDWLVTAINILVQIADLSSQSGAVVKNVYEVPGVVFIDEIDKNYHPKLQEEIVPWFTSKFPNLQFVISTHSPYLIRSLGEDCVVVKLPQGDVISEDFTYWDVNEVSSKIFGRDIGFSRKVELEIKEFKNLLRGEAYAQAIDKYMVLSGKSESLKQELNRISYTLGSNEFVEAINNAVNEAINAEN
ncbi:AAA family ATPase [Aeromonas veronii]|uniref:AAA family ATPase n=1 Tax=Aeromonas veronii TaxID=654 RepID=UPI001F1B749C|nr:AAA family ATPase [Aeromonas veronii]MCF5760052.1 AAA family ATPase [Aeromonas veronii]